MPWENGILGSNTACHLQRCTITHLRLYSQKKQIDLNEIFAARFKMENFRVIMKVVLLLIAAGHASCQADQQPKLICYWESWSGNRPVPGNFSLDNFDATLCTHLVFSFVNVAFDGRIVESGDNSELYYAMERKRNENPNLKLLFAVGGWDARSENFTEVANDTQKRSNFANSAVDFLKRYNFDGIDIDWEYPGDTNQGGTDADKANLPLLLDAVKKALQGITSTSKNFSLTLACGVGPERVERGYDFARLNDIVDHYNLMAYDLRMFRRYEDEAIGHHAAFNKSSSDSNYTTNLNIVSIIDDFKNKGATVSKMILGVGAYGRTYQLRSRAEHNLGSVALNLGPKGPFVATEGVMAQSEICYETLRSGSRFEFNEDKEAGIPYAFNDTLWIGYDNERSAVRKTNYALSQGLAGMMIWSIDQDDCNNICGGWYKCPITTAIKNRLVSWVPGNQA